MDHSKVSEACVANTSKRIFFDEAWRYLFNNDGIRSMLKKVEGVPKVVYSVDNGCVFVFSCLVDLVHKATSEKGATLDDVEIRALLPSAYLSPIDAVSKYGVWPSQYKPKRVSAGGYVIEHEPFNARLPGLYEGTAELNCALASLLAGETIPGEGDFEYLGQPMTLLRPLELQGWENLPIYEYSGSDAARPFLYLRPGGFEPGFSPLTPDLYQKIQGIEKVWNTDESRVFNQVRARFENAPIGFLGDVIDLLNEAPSSDGEIYSEDHEITTRILHFYPELKTLKPKVAIDCLSDFQANELCPRGLAADHRDEDFIFYLVGRAFGNEKNDDFVLSSFGLRIVHLAHHGFDLPAAVDLASKYTRFSIDLSDLAQRIFSATSFLRDEKKSSGRGGSEVKTMSDLIREGRKYNSAIHHLDVNGQPSKT